MLFLHTVGLAFAVGMSAVIALRVLGAASAMPLPPLDRFNQVIGAVGILDLRMIGMARGFPIASVQRLMPWAVLGFVVNLITGVLFFVGEPQQYEKNIAFLMKMLFIVLAGVNVFLFYATGLHKRVDEMAPGGEAPIGARIVGAASLVLWIGVVYWGRMLPFIGNAF